VKRVRYLPVIILLLSLLAGCGPVHLALQAETPAPTTTPAPLPSPTSPPVETLMPRPTATWVPTVTPRPPTPTASLPAELQETLDAVEAEMEGLRGLSLTMPVTRTLMTPEELAAFLEADFAKEYPPDEIEADVRVLAAFDFVPPDFDLRQVLLDVYASEILGLYDDKVDTLYVVNTGEFSLLDELTFGHEYVHGLQDQTFGLDTFVDDDRLNDDQYLARLALVEGDASLAMVEYLLAHVSELAPGELQALFEEDTQSNEDVLQAAPAIISETLGFPYIYGLEFVSRLQDEGWEVVDSAFADPPQSTEQILHPEKYLTRDEPQMVTVPPLTDTLGIGWHLVEAETLGEFQTTLYLAQQMDKKTAEKASQGWDGDQYAVYADDGASLLIFATAWDSAQDREEFVAAYEQYATGKYQQPPARSKETQIWWETPTQTAVLTWGEDTALLILGPNPEIVARALAVARP
jgi:hypothetical protein